jgi:hypothetical protein
MTCRDVLALSDNFLDNELPEEMGDRIRRHLLGCAACREEIDSVRMALEVLHAARMGAEPDEAFTTNALEMLARQLDLTTRLPTPPGQLVLGIGE